MCILSQYEIYTYIWSVTRFLRFLPPKYVEYRRRSFEFSISTARCMTFSDVFRIDELVKILPSQILVFEARYTFHNAARVITVLVTSLVFACTV